MKKCILMFFLLCWGNCFAQNEYMQWVMQNYELDFCDSVYCISNLLSAGGPLGPATICDRNTGHLLFYTDGTQVLNSTFQLMPNGAGLKGDLNSTQGALIVPLPGSANFYYIFTSNRFSWPGGLGYSIIDMTKDGGLGDVTVKNVYLDSTTEKLNAVYNETDNFFWVIALNPNTNNYMSFRLDSAGLDTTPVLSPSHVIITNTFQRAGYLKSSPNGNKIVVLFEGEPYTIGLYNFNKNSGVLSLQTFLPLDSVDDAAYGASFSPDNSKLYVGGYTSNVYSKIYQYDLSSNDTDSIKTSRTNLITVNYNSYFGGMQIGPDRKIYINKNNVDSISVIEKPNLAGSACQFMLDKIVIPISTFNGVAGLSNNIDGLYYFADSNNINLSYSILCNKKDSFKINTTRTYDYFQVNFGDGSDTLLDSTQFTFTHQYNSAGTYVVKLTTASGCDIQDSVTISVTADTAKCPSAIARVTISSLIIPTFIYGNGSQTQWSINNLPPNTAATIYDELGRNIYKTSNYLNNYDMRNLPPAMYFYRLDLQNGVEYKGKVLVVK